MGLNAAAPWLREPMRRAVDAFAAGRLAHALLVCGPAQIGKRAFADALVRSILCRARVDGAPCGHCRDCILLAAGTHPDFRYVGLEENDKTKVMRKEIVIEQVRDLGAWFALTPQRGGAQVALIEPATAMNVNASNALLKTLEEPMHNRYLLLLSESPMQLVATIRSRCQRIDLRAPDAATALDWLVGSGHEEAVAAQALAVSRGNPGQAERWIAEGTLALRASVRADLAALAERRAKPLEVAANWLADGVGEQRLVFAAEFAVDLQLLALAGSNGVTSHAETALAKRLDPYRVPAWFDLANRTRGLLRTPIRGDLAVAGLLQGWRESFAE